MRKAWILLALLSMAGIIGALSVEAQAVHPKAACSVRADLGGVCATDAQYRELQAHQTAIKAIMTLYQKQAEDAAKPEALAQDDLVKEILTANPDYQMGKSGFEKKPPQAATSAAPHASK